MSSEQTLAGSSIMKPVDAQVGWEDWDEDQRRALAASHKRTIGSLEEDVEAQMKTSASSRSDGQSVFTAVSTLQSESQLANQGKSTEETGEVEVKRSKYLSRKCLTVASVGVLAVAGIAALASMSTWLPSPEPQFMFQDFSLVGTMMGYSGHSQWVPPHYGGLFSDINLPMDNVQPVLWTMPRSGSLCIMDILSYCGKLVLSNGAARGHEQEDSLTIFTQSDSIGHFANVDTTTLAGLERAHRLNLIDSGLVHVVATPHLPEASMLFEHKAKTGRIFAIFRDPVQRAVSDYLFLRSLDSGDALGLPPSMTLSQFVESDYLTTNVLTKTLANLTDDTIVTELHVMFAKQLIHEKILVGLADNFEESLNRFLAYFGWVLHDSVCAANFILARDTRESNPILEEHEEESRTLSDRNWTDVEVYEFAKLVFSGQNHIDILSV